MGSAQTPIPSPGPAHRGPQLKLAQQRDDRDPRPDRWRLLDKRIVSASSEPPDKRDRVTEARLRAELEAARGRLEELDKRLARECPDYAEIASPQPVPLAEAQALLAADEALVTYAVWDKSTFLQVIRSNRAALHQVEIGADETPRLLAIGIVTPFASSGRFGPKSGRSDELPRTRKFPPDQP